MKRHLHVRPHEYYPGAEVRADGWWSWAIDWYDGRGRYDGSTLGISGCNPLTKQGAYREAARLRRRWRREEERGR